MIPETSIEAYKKSNDLKETHHRKIEGVLLKKKGYTYREIAALLGWSNPNDVSRRMKELVELKKAKITKTRICTVGGNSCMTYVKI